MSSSRKSGDASLSGLAGYAGYPPLAKSKPTLLRMLSERRARSALIEYDGGHDEGWVTKLVVSPEPLGVDPRSWSGQELPGAEDIELDLGTYDHESGELTYVDDASRSAGELAEAAMAVVCDKWGTFAGDFKVQGRLIVDVDSKQIVRHDVGRWDDEEGEPGESFHDVEEV